MQQNGYTALIAASQIGHADCVGLLLEYGANKDATDHVRYVASWRPVSRPEPHHIRTLINFVSIE